MNLLKFGILASLALILSGCGSGKKAVTNEVVISDTSASANPVVYEYQAARPRTYDIIHTRLNLSFGWDSAFVYGLATITIKPYFHPISNIALDAKGFLITSVSEVKKGDKEDSLKYNYDDKKIDISLGRELSPDDTIDIRISYTAMPYKLKTKGSQAIAEDRGMYFINRDGKDKKKPRQLWTQGETEANSCWFPTFDSPNERMTTDIFVTIEEGQTSVSNGLKHFSVDNGNGTKTEYWKMEQPHAPYLVMLAVGPFVKYEDKWGSMEVGYYLDSAFLPYAKQIFGNTPEMLTFYSDYLGVKYPWPKYDQIVVHDFVSGAMENTTATIHGEFLQMTDRELRDYNNEDVISHELFHHWFGDLVTCESWSNLTLNEGFATYGEYLWNEHKYGRDKADFELQSAYEAYLSEASNKNVDLIRFRYNDKEDMFDAHSYSKGGLILHMLRHYAGEKAFRASLNHYLVKHAYSNVEVHDLRMAFEEVTGEDYNWFFNQWHLSSGHPILKVRHEYDSAKGEVTIFASQAQDTDKYPLYRLPVNLEIQCSDGLKKTVFDIRNMHDSIVVKSAEKPGYVNFNTGNVVLAEIEQAQTEEEWKDMYAGSTLAIDKARALDALIASFSASNYVLFTNASSSPRWEIRNYALQYFLTWIATEASDTIRNKITEMAQQDADWRIRYFAIEGLNELYDDSAMKALCLEKIGDSSLIVSAVALNGLVGLDPESAGNIIRGIKKFESNHHAQVAGQYYTKHGNTSDFGKISSIIEDTDNYSKYQILSDFNEYLERTGDSSSGEALVIFNTHASGSDQWWVRMAAINGIIGIHARSNGNSQTADQADSVDTKSADLHKQSEEILIALKTIETKENLLGLITDYLEGRRVYEK